MKVLVLFCGLVDTARAVSMLSTTPSIDNFMAYAGQHPNDLPNDAPTESGTNAFLKKIISALPKTEKLLQNEQIPYQNLHFLFAKSNCCVIRFDGLFVDGNGNPERNLEFVLTHTGNGEARVTKGPGR